MFTLPKNSCKVILIIKKNSSEIHETFFLAFTDEQKKTKRGEPFLRYDSTSIDMEGENGFMIFYTDFNMRRLENSPTGMTDGTFKRPKKLFAQLMTIHGQHGQGERKLSFPCVYFLLPNKEEATYVRALRQLKSLAPDFGKKLQNWMCDFEPALRNALATVFPGTPVNGCNFHFTVGNYVFTFKTLSCYKMRGFWELHLCFEWTKVN